MDSVSQQFKSLVLTETNFFSSILDIMYHTQKEEGRRLLNMINNIIDDLLSKSSHNEDKVNLHIIHLHSCPEWGRELLVRFLIYKISLSLNYITIERLKQSIQKVIMNNDCKEVKQIQDRNKYFRKVSKVFENFDTPHNDQKSLFIIKEQDLTVKKTDKNPWFHDFFSGYLNDKNHNIILSTNDTAFDLEKTIKGLEKNYIPTIENVFIFHSPNKSRITNSYNTNQLQRLNKYGLGVKNCIVFSFSDQPFKLYHAIDNVKNRLSSSLLNKTIGKYDDFDGFITFTQEEIDFLFNHKINLSQENFFVDCLERSFFISEIDQILDQIPHNLRYKDNLALSFTDNLQNNFAESISQEIKDFSKELYGDYFNLLKELWNNDITSRIEAFIGNCSSVGFILPKSINRNIKDSLSKLFEKYNRSIRYYSLEDLKRGISVEKLVILQYCYTNKFHKVYPNSFDPLPLKDKQRSLTIINLLTHNNYFEWNSYWYNKDLNRLLFSNFRKEKLGWEKKFMKKPSLSNVIDYIHEAENDARIYQTDKCKIHYNNDGRSKEYFACERVLYKEGDSLRIAELKDVATLENISIQMLDEIIEQVKTLISEKSEDKTKAETFLRRDPKFNLSDSEINSPTELWKILLKRRVNSLGVKVVYDTMFKSIHQNDRISLNTFSQWYNFENSMILPRSRKHQIALFTYLGFELRSAYPLIMIAKKLSNINNSRLLNSQIETFLQKSLVSIVNEKSFEVLSESHADIFALLDINNREDINALIDLLEISLTPIKRIEYDQD